MPPKDSIANTFLVSIILCVVCSLLVSSAAVLLKPLQERNKLLDQKRNIIAAAGLSGEKDASELSGKEVEELFDKRVTKKLLNIDTAEYIDNPDPLYDPRKAAKDDKTNTEVEEYNIGIAKREIETWVYLVKDKNDKIEQLVLPVYGKGLWSTLYGYVALKNDFRTIAGLTYYEHGETPGLGGEVENPAWKAKWPGKEVWEVGEPREDQYLRVGVAKGAPTGDNTKYEVDGLSGATITSRGVDVMLKYWFSDEAFGPYLKKLASQQGAADGKSNS